MGASKGIRYKRGRNAYLILSIVMYVVLFTKGASILSGAVFLWFQLLGGYAYARTSMCPLEIMVRLKPTQYNKAFRRMYKTRYIEMTLMYFGFVSVLICTIIAKLILWIR